MSTQRTTKTCESNSSYCKFGSEILLKLISGFEEQIEGVIENVDIESVHKTRVTSRRLRAALPLFCFCFPKKAFSKWSQEIKKVTRLLANARDLDVQTVFIEQYIKNLESDIERTNIKVLLKDHRSRRKNIQYSINAGLEELKSTKILEAISRACEQNIKDHANELFDPQKVLEKAHWHISYRLDDFLAMERFVHLENEKLRHHEMRIYAKKLRYTMETFAALYENKLSTEIKTMKSFQDMLGEMHDADVWIEYIPKFMKENNIISKGKNRKATEQALLNFLKFVKEKRAGDYGEFVDLWDEKNEVGFFDGIRGATKEGFPTVDEKIKGLLEDPKVKIGLLSDVHANLQALEQVFVDAEKRGVTVFLNAGDSVGFGPWPNEVVELLCEKNVLSVVGNFDLEVIEGNPKGKGEKKIALKFAKKELSKSCEYYLHSLPRELRLEVTGKKLLVTHGSPESIEEHINRETPTERLRELAEASKSDIIVNGHSHEQLSKRVNHAHFINPGSVGRPGDGNPKAAYALLSFNPFKVELLRLNYDVDDAVDDLRKKGLPESFPQMLLRGVPIDRIIEEDKTRTSDMVEKCSQLVRASEDFSEKIWPDREHYAHVNRLVLEMFDGLCKLHKLGERERCWLECASILHDIGMSKTGAQHHKKTAKLILNNTSLPFTSTERRIVASIARYHRKGLPKPKHTILAPLDKVTIRKIEILASLLRVADALDYSHQAKVKTINIKASPKKIVVECFCESISLPEEQAFNKKKDLFEKIFAKSLMLVWKQQPKPPGM